MSEKIGSVYDGWASYRGEIQVRDRNGKRKWRWVIYRTFIREEECRTGWWSGNYEKVLKRGRRELLSYKQDRYDTQIHL